MMTELPIKTVRAGDVIVLSAPTVLQASVAKALRKKLRKAFPAAKVLVLSDGLTIDVVATGDRS